MEVSCGKLVERDLEADGIEDNIGECDYWKVLNKAFRNLFIIFSYRSILQNTAYLLFIESLSEGLVYQFQRRYTIKCLAVTIALYTKEPLVAAKVLKR